MKYVDKLLQETDFFKRLQRLEQLEENRVFCKHGLTHLLDTARIAWIGYLEQENELRQISNLEKEDVYLAALLHDLGRLKEYEEGVPHHEAGAEMAEELLRKIHCPEEKIKMLVSAIANHRENKNEEFKNENLLGELLYWADKKSRNCFLCQAQETCKWHLEKRNQTITY